MISERLLKSQQMVRDKYDPNFCWLELDTPDWIEMKKSLEEATVALITSCGFYRIDSHIPFDAFNHLGDPSFREIHIDTPLDRLAIAHNHYDHRYVREDLGVALPIDHFKSFERDGTIGKFYPWIYSFMGYIPEPHQFIREACDTIGHRLAADHVDAAIFTPC